MTIWQTPAGIVDEGGMVLGAWLNFGLSLEAPPANGLMHVSLMPLRTHLSPLLILCDCMWSAIQSLKVLHSLVPISVR